MTSYYPSNEYGVFHFGMGTQSDTTLLVLVVVAITILVGAWYIWLHVPAKS
jgi:hypothetical protein